MAATIAPERLPPETADLLRDSRNPVYFSAASIWEIAVKHALNRQDFDFLPDDLHRLALDTGFAELPIHADHCYPVARLPWHHRDPFDRLPIAQTQTLPARLLTADSALPAVTLVALR